MAISGDNQVRVLEVNRGLSVTISGLTIENGRDNPSSGNPYAGQGSGILNLGTLALSDCTVTHNQSTLGGGIANFGTLTVSHCIFSYNTAQQGGGIFNSWGDGDGQQQHLHQQRRGGHLQLRQRALHRRRRQHVLLTRRRRVEEPWGR